MKIKKIISTLFAMLIFCMGVVFATGEGSGTSQLVDKAWEITSALLWVGYAIALGMVVYIGIKYITGAADAKANMKTAIINYLIGALLVFAATTIAGIVIGIATSDSDPGGLANKIIESAESAAE